MTGLLGRKLGMSRLFADNGASVGVTILEAGPNVVLQIKTVEKEGYNAIQVGFGKRSEKRVNKPTAGHLKKSGAKPVQRVAEFRLDSIEGYQLGQEIKADMFVVGEKVDVLGVSKGLGFQGVVRRYKFAGGPQSHGQSDRLRAPGSVGASSYPSRTFKGQKMGGRMGGDSVTARNVQVFMVDPEKNIIAVRGSVPGKKNSFVTIRKQ